MKIIMKKQSRKAAAILISFALVLTMLAGCSKGETQSNEGEVESAASVDNGSLSNQSCVISVGSTKVTYAEFMVYSYILKNEYENTFTTDVWQYDIGSGTTIGMEAVEEIVRLIVEVKVMQREADNEKVSLAVEENDEVSSRVTAIMDKLPKEYVDKYGISQDLVKQVFTNNELARKMYDIVTGKVTDTVTDETARQATIQYIYLSTKSMSEDEKSAAKIKADKLLKKAKKSKKFEAFAQENTEASQVEMTVDSSYKEENIAAAAMSLKKKQLSQVVEGTDGYYILYCVTPNDKEATQKKKEELVREGQEKLFTDTYDAWMKKYDVKVSTSLTINE